VGESERVALDVEGDVEAWSVDATPALSVRWAFFTRLHRAPTLVVSGINFGENIGVSIPISGTVGAATEAACLGAPAVAVSLETDPEHFRSHSETVDFTIAATVTRRVAAMVLGRGLPDGIDVLNVNVPADATAKTPWRWTRVSREHYFDSIVHEDPEGERRIAGWRTVADPSRLAPDDDIRAMAIDRHVSISPITVDPTGDVGCDWLNGHGAGDADGEGDGEGHRGCDGDGGGDGDGDGDGNGHSRGDVHGGRRGPGA
jgi:5'-nucleotidase